MAVAYSELIHATAVIDPDAILAPDVQIGAYSIIEGPVQVGSGCVIEAHACLSGPLRMGRDNFVAHGAVLGKSPQHRGYCDEPTGLEIGDGNVFRMDLTGYSGETRMAQYTYEATEIRQLTRSRERRRYGATREVCTNGTWWRQGTYDMAHNVFRRDGETWEVINGVPDRMPNGQVIPNGNVHWVRVRQFWIDIYQEPYWERVTSTASINALRQAFRILYREGRPISAALDRIEQDFGEISEVAEFLSFIRQSKLGINPARSTERGNYDIH